MTFREDFQKAVRRAVSNDPRKANFDSGSYRLLRREPVGAGLKRILTAQVDDAVAELRGEEGTDPADAVHEARKDIKKIRSALRLVRQELGDEVWRRENDRYRQIARSLSGFRDSEVMIEALDGLAERFGESAQGRFDPLREQLAEGNRGTHEDGSLRRAKAGAAAALAAGRGRFETLPLEGDGWELLGPGLHRTYRRGRRRLRAAEEDASVTKLHELRKRVKDLWYQL